MNFDYDEDGVAKPRCPNPLCGAEGVDNIVCDTNSGIRFTKTKNPCFDVVFCAECGHIYGVYSAHPSDNSPIPD